MIKCRYTAISKYGQTIRGVVENQTKTEVVKRLRENELFPLKVKEERIVISRKKIKERRNKISPEIEELLKNASKRNEKKIYLRVFRKGKIKTRDLLAFNQSFYLLKKADFNNIQALTSIITTTENEEMRDVVTDILSGVEAGEKIYTTMEYYPTVFPAVYVNIVKTGELSGSLADALQDAQKYLEDTDNLKRNLRKAILPNAMQFATILVLMFGGILFMVPKLQKVYEGYDYPIPDATMAFFNFTNTLMSHWYLVLSVLVGIIAIYLVYTNTPKGRYRRDYFLLKIPFVGRIITLTNLNKYFQAMQLNLRNGIRIQEAIDIGKDVMNNMVLRAVAESAKNNIVMGKSWVEPYQNLSVIPVVVSDMLSVGMETDIVSMVDKIINYLTQDVENAVDALVKAMPSITYVVAGLALIGFIIVMVAPLIELYMGNFIWSAI